MGIRLFIVFIGGPLLVWTLLSVFARNVRDSAWYAWNETAIEFREMRAAFKSKSMNEEDWT